MAAQLNSNLQDQITTININLTTISSSLAQKGTDIYIRKGNIVEASIVNEWMNQRNVPSGYRPAGMRHFLLWGSTTSSIADVYYYNGKFNSADHNFAGTMVWITIDPMPS